MRTIIVVACAVMLLSRPGTAQTVSPAERSRIDEVFGEYARPDSPGCALGVYRDGLLLYAHGYGMASLELAVPITPATVFDIGSTSKQFTAFAILLLEQRGKLSVDDDIRKFIPELPDYGKRITLRHLLTHTSGLRDYTALFDLAGVPEQNLTTDEDALNLLVRQKALNFSPGEEWQYSNSGFFLLSQVVKRVTGRSLRDFAQDNIFTPLGMKATQIFNNHSLVIRGRATGYSYDGGRKTFGVEMSNFEQTGDGSVQTSVEDLLKWDENFYTATLGGADLLRRMQIAGRLNSGEQHGYANGLMMSTYRGQPIVSHGGAWAGYRAELLRFPEQHMSVAVLCNLAESTPSVRARRVADIVLSSVLTPAAQASPGAGVHAKVPDIAPDVLRSYTGLYKNEKQEYRRVELKDGKLWLATFGIELIPQSETVFGTPVSDGSIRFAPDGQMIIISPSGKPDTYARIAPGTPKDIARLAGKYYCPELDATWEVRLRDGALIAGPEHALDSARPLTPIRDDLFTFGSGTIQFVVRPGERTRALLSIARIRNLELLRAD